MAKTITFGGIIVVVLLIAFSSLPSGDVTDSKSAIKNTQKGLATDTVVKAGGEVIETTGQLAINSACRDGASQGCSTTTTTINWIGVIFAIFVVGLFIAGIYGAIKFGMKLLESIGIL